MHFLDVVPWHERPIDSSHSPATLTHTVPFVFLFSKQIGKLNSAFLFNKIRVTKN